MREAQPRADRDDATLGLPLEPLLGVRLLLCDGSFALNGLRDWLDLGPHQLLLGYCRGGSLSLSCEDSHLELGCGSVFACRRPAVGTGVFSGTLVLLSLDELTEPALRTLSGFGVDGELLSKVVHAEEPLQNLGAYPALAHVFAEMSTPPLSGELGYLRLKAIELLSASCTLIPVPPRQEPVAQPGGEATARRKSHDMLALEAQALMMRDLSRPLTIAALAQATGSSPTVLKQAFKVVFGVPIYSWYRSYRIHQAAELLLSTSCSISEAAAAVGYSNPSKFSKAFVDCLGQTPSAWRKLVR